MRSFITTSVIVFFVIWLMEKMKTSDLNYKELCKNDEAYVCFQLYFEQLKVKGIEISIILWKLLMLVVIWVKFYV